ncbi:protein S100-A11 [Acanthopagrus latus]|uniref:protein S100-A11 n=1 Tax=Acanthopagrus latus TaxID=8177 RepID=UPI00187C729E|nr:protein S100-A11 [Acanthopagrus latus]
MKHIYSERRWSERRDTVLVAAHNTPHSIPTQEASAQIIMESAICTIVTQFKNYAGKDGSSSTLSKEEFHNLVSSQLSNYVQNAGDPAAVDQLMSSLDENNDGELTFLEFWQLVGKLASQKGGFGQ